MTLINEFSKLSVTCLGETFADIAIALAESLRCLGWQVRTDMQVDLQDGEAAIVLGAFHDIEKCLAFKDRIVVYNFEQLNVERETVIVTDDYLKLLRQVEMWDYCKSNIDWAAKNLGVKAAYIPLGYSPAFEKPEWLSNETPEFDVLFYGGANLRRRQILKHIENAGLRVFIAKAYRSHLAKRIRSSRLVVNIGFYKSGSILETARLAPLLATGIPVVSEARPGLEVPHNMEGTFLEYPTGALAQNLKALCQKTEALQKHTRAARQKFMSDPWPDIIARGLDLNTAKISEAGTQPSVHGSVSAIEPSYFRDIETYNRSEPPQDHGDWGEPYKECFLSHDTRASENMTTLRRVEHVFEVPEVPVHGRERAPTGTGVYDAFNMRYKHAVIDAKDARIFMPFGGITIPEEKLLLKESTWQAMLWFHPLFRADASTDWRWRHNESAAIPDARVDSISWCYHQYNFQYFHWFIDCLPRYWLLEQTGLLQDNLYFGELQPGTPQAISLDLIAPKKKVLPSLAGKIVDVCSLRMPASELNETAKMRPSRGKGVHFKGGWDPIYLAWLSKKIVDGVNKLAANSDYQGHPLVDKLIDRQGELKLFLGRSKAAHRRSLGWPGLSSWMRDEGYVEVEPGEFSFIDQVRLFNRADRIVGVHGAAFTNILWCDKHRNPKILELTVSGMDDPGYRMIAYGRGLSYAALPCKPANYEGDRLGYADILIDANSLKNAVRSLD